MITVLRAHKRVITFSLVAFCAFWLSRGALHRFYFLPFFATFVMLIASQLFWIRRVLDIGERFIPGKPRRTWLAIVATVVYVFFFFAYRFAPLGILLTTGQMIHTADPRLRRVLIDGAFSVWLVGSGLGFGLVMVFWSVDRGARGAIWVYRYMRGAAAGHATAPEPDAIALLSPARRHLLRQMAIAVSATPFVAAAYGLLYSRLDVEVTHRRIALARLPKAFEGFRIAQLSDFHISPFMSADEIRRCVTTANQLKTDLVVLTGDYLCWDPAAQGEVVRALAGLRAPYGVFGCLGNHEVITQTEESITRLFAAQGIRILRQDRAPIQFDGETLNLIGVDDSQPDLKGIERLVMPDAVNILLVHNIGADFDRAGELGIDLTLMGHTHGGQLSLEFLRRGLSFARLETPYVSGWYEKSRGRLYVNRGIGTTLVPIRLGARPEITVFELVRGV
jgi:predicted MPP superfamily phosphohydrolase